MNSLRASRRLTAIEKLPLHPADRVASFLVKVLDDVIEEVRAAAATKLGQIRSPRSIAPLVKLLLHERDPLVHAAASAALASCPAEGWVGTLVAALDDSDTKVSEAASSALRTIGWPFLDGAVRGRVAVMRCDWTLAAELGPDAVPALQNKLRNGTALVRREAADALCKIADEKSLNAIVEVLRDRRVDPGARETAAWALRTLQWHEVNPVDAARAAIALGHWSDVVEIGAEAVAPLAIAMRGANEKVRRQAAETLGAIGGREAADALGAVLVDQSLGAPVRAVAAQELARIGGEHVVSYLTAALSDKEWSVRSAAARSLDEMDWKPTRPWNRALHAIATQRIADAVAVGPTAIPALADALRFPAVSDAVGAALVGMGREGTDALAAISKDPKAELPLREAASTALASIGDARAVEPLHAMLKDTDPAVRHSAVWALERLGWEPKADADRAVVALVHENWAALGKIGVGAVEPLMRHMAVEHESSHAAETLLKIVESSSGRIPIDQLRRMARLGDPTPKGSGESNTVTMTHPAISSLAKAARYEMIRRGIMK